MYGICTTFIAAEKIEAGEACFVGSDGRLRKALSPIGLEPVTARGVLVIYSAGLAEWPSPCLPSK